MRGRGGGEKEKTEENIKSKQSIYPIVDQTTCCLQAYNETTIVC